MRTLLTVVCLIGLAHVVSAQSNVGIGLPNPQSKFHVHTPITSLTTLAQFTSSYTDNGAMDGFQILLGPDGAVELRQRESANFSIYTNELRRLFISSSGKVGINTTTSLGAADVTLRSNNNTSWGGMYIQSPDASGGKPFYGYASTGVRAYHYWDESTDHWRLYTAGNEWLKVGPNGVGVGNSNDPDKPLHVRGDMRLESSNSLIFDLLVNTSGQLEVRRGGAGVGDYFFEDGQAEFAIGSSASWGRQRLRMTNGLTGVWMTASEVNGEGGSVIVYNSAGGKTGELDGDFNGDNGGQFELYASDGGRTVELRGSEGVGDNGGSVILYNDSGTKSAELDGDRSNLGGGQLLLLSNTGTTTVDIRGSESTTDGGTIYMYNNSGVKTVEIDSDFGSKGRITTDELEITGGSDLAEFFEVSDPMSNVTAGTAVCIDTDGSGGLRICDEERDRTVAGIVSGAGGVNTGLIMRQEGSIADGQFPIAIQGRVYAHAVGGSKGIKPGDMLTTSSVPGHLTSTRKLNKARGAIVGKALTGLGADKSGLVLVLIIPQ